MKNSPNNVSSWLRIMVGLYLIYIDYSWLKNWQQLDNKILFMIFFVIFGIVGLLLIVFSLKNLINDKNKDHKDPDEKKDNSQDM